MLKCDAKLPQLTRNQCQQTTKKNEHPNKQHHHEHLKHLLVFQGFITPKKNEELFVIVHNMGAKEIILTHEDNIASLHLVHSKVQPLNIIPFSIPPHVLEWLNKGSSQSSKKSSKPH